MLYEKSEELLKGLYKAASFLVQAIYFQQTKVYLHRQKELFAAVLPEEKRILDIFLSLKRGEAIDFQAMSEVLFVWSKGWIEKTK